MPSDHNIDAFVEKGLAAGIPHQSLVGILTSQGWPEKEIYSALADHYQRTSGLEIPRRASTGTSAKEAFFYLLIFSTLATWTVGLGCLAFSLIDRWFADPLFLAYGQSLDTYTITYSLAAIIVAFPLYLLISRIVVKDATAHPEKLDSSVRKWLTYMALVIAAAVFMGDLIGAIAYLLRGELTSRFVAKSLVVLALSGGVFFYYFGGVRKSDATAARLNTDRVMAGLSAAIVVVFIVLGFQQLGTPKVQREIRADAQRVNHLYNLSSEIHNYWKAHSSQLPENTGQLPVDYRDPITQASYEYHPQQGSKYELCANFASKSEERGNTAWDAWRHPAGHYCFSLDATMIAQYSPLYVGY